jgi:hypothetical protein
MIIEEEVWVVMSKDRHYIAKGVPRDRWLIPVEKKNDKKRVLTYSSKGRAEASYRSDGYFQVPFEGYDRSKHNIADYIEPVKVKIKIEEIKD